MAKRKKKEDELDKLTDEQLLAEEETLSFVDTEDLESLTDEELLAEESKIVGQQPEPVSELESTARGAIQGATLGFADEISGAVESAFTEKTFEQARDESRSNFKDAQVANPVAYIMGEVAGGIATTVSTGGLSAGFRGAAVIGGLAGIGFSNRTGSDLLLDGSIGATFGLAGETVAKGIGKFVQKMFKNSSPKIVRVFEDIGETTRPENVKFESNLIKDAFAGRYGSADEWAITPTFGRQVQNGLDDAPELMKSMFRDKRKQLGGQIEAIIDDLPQKNIDVSDIIDEFKDGLKNNLRNSGADRGARTIIQREILDLIDEGKFATRGGQRIDINKMTPLETMEFKRSIQEIVFSDVTPDGQVNLIKDSPRANEILQKIGNDITERANALDATGKLRAVNKQYSQIIQADSLIPRKEESFKLLKLQDVTGLNKASGEMRTLNQLLEGIDPEFRVKVIREINPRLSAFKLHQAATFTGGTVSTAFRSKAGASAGEGLGGTAGRIIGGIAGAGESAIVNTANAFARARKVFKVPRSVAGIFENSDMIVSKLSTVSPVLAITLSDLISDGNENAVEEFIKELMNNPQSQGQFEDGFGFEGKAVTEEELAQARSQIMGSSMPLAEKIQAISALAADGTVPTEEQMAPRITEPTQQQEERQLSLENLERVKALEKDIE